MINIKKIYPPQPSLRARREQSSNKNGNGKQIEIIIASTNVDSNHSPLLAGEIPDRERGSYNKTLLFMIPDSHIK